MSQKPSKTCQCRTCEHYRVMIKTSYIRNLSDKIKHAYTVDIVVRTDGVEKSFDGGFLKELL